MMNSTNYNPDVLSCLANLSNDEVFTPPAIVNQMLDLLPVELWQDKTATFLDPVSKSGVFLREITKRLNEGLKEQVPDEQKRINHILTKQVFGIALTELTALLSRRTLYCTKTANSPYSICTEFDNEQGNLFYEKTLHRFQNEKCVFCGASQSVYDRAETAETYAYPFIHQNNPFEKMKFDVIIGNPPYQLSDGGSGTGISAKPLYHEFVKQSQKLNPRYLTMIIPSRWFAGGKGLDDFRDDMLKDKRIRTLVDYPKSRDCFPGVDIAGGVCYFLWDRDDIGDCNLISRVGKEEKSRIRKLDEFDILIRDNIGIDIIRKVMEHSKKMMSTMVYSRNPFGFVSSDRGKQQQFEDAITLISSEGKGYISLLDIDKNANIVNNYKVIIGKVNPDRGGVNNASDGKMNVITKVNIVNPKEVFTETYLLLADFKEKFNAENCASFFRTKFTRFLISLTLSSMNITKENFQFVPIPNFDENWTDEKLYKKYGLTENEIAFIESMVKPMEI